MAVKKAKTKRKVATRRAPKARRTGLAAMTDRQVLDRLAEVGRIAALFIEGEDVIEALRPECRTWTDADDINFDAAVAVPLKKTLLRIEQIEPFTYYAILWVRRNDDPSRVEVILAGRRNSVLDHGKGQRPPIFGALRTVFDRGRPASIARKDPKLPEVGYGHGWIVRNDSLLRAGHRLISYFQPIRDSRENVVAALELTTVGMDN